ncbi:MAG TPA: OsmC family protein [Bryobacteraceae bacterium]|nr:OsmC family protein [Bryobacteraceae bacterium]
MEVITEYLGKTKFAVSARGHRVICDQPLDNHGEDTGMTPPEFMLAALGSCAGYYAAEYLNARGLPSKDLVVRVIAEKARQPARLGSFRIEVNVPGLDERDRAGVMRAVKACLIHNTLLATPNVEVEINSAVPVPA